MSAIVPWLTAQHGLPGYVMALALYWLGFCVPVYLLHVRDKGDAGLFSERLAWRNWWVPLALLAQVMIAALLIFVPNTQLLTTHGAIYATALALINAPLEELAWRGGFMHRFRDRPRLGLWLGWGIFVVMHVPLTLSDASVGFDRVGLVIGAALAGAVWSFLAWRTGSIFYVTIAHVLTNILAFWVLFNQNGFG